MRLLIVEDSDEVVEAIVVGLQNAGFEPVVARAESRVEGEALVCGDSEFDLGIFDLRIPSEKGVPDHDPSHGRSVFYLAAEQRPGMLSWVFSGFADADFMEEMIDDPRTGDPFGLGAVQSLVSCYRKSKAPELVADVVKAAGDVRDLSHVELSYGGQNLGLTSDQETLLRILLRRHGATVGQIAAFEPGLSGTRVVRIVGLGVHGEQLLNCVVKVGPKETILEEEERFRDGVAGVLPAGCFAPLNESLHAGAGRSSLLCYSLAGMDPSPLLNLVAQAEGRAVGALRALQGELSIWIAGGYVETLNPGEVLVRLGAPHPSELHGDRVPACSPATVATVLGRSIQVRTCTQHGDLHLGNVLIAAGDRPVLIDFGRTTNRISTYDAATLELSLYFHPDGRGLAADWPTPAQAAQIDDLDAYLAGCPCPDFVRACRAWAHENAVSDREVWFALLAVALRQLRFPDAPERAVAVAGRTLELLT